MIGHSRTVGWVVAAASGTLAGRILPPGAFAEVAGDLAFVMAVLGASIYWSAVLLSIGSARSPGSGRVEMVSMHVRRSVRTALVAASGVVVVLVAALPVPDSWVRMFGVGTNIAAAGVFALFVAGVLDVMASLQDVADSRLREAEGEDVVVPPGSMLRRKDSGPVFVDIPVD